MFETFDHTADIGLRIRASTINELFQDAARGLFSLLIDDLETIRPTIERTVQLSADSWDMLLFDWLDHLLYLFDAERLALSEFDVTVQGFELSAKVRGEIVDSTRHPLAHEVKAITYHGLFVRRDGNEWLAEVIVDI